MNQFRKSNYLTKKPKHMKRIFTFFVVLLISASVFGQQNQYRWTATGGGTAADFGEGVATDEAGNAYITGYFRYSMNLLGTEIIPVSQQNTMFLAKVSPEKDLVWAVTAEADGTTGAGGFKTVYKNGYVYLMGDFRGNATFFSSDFSETNLTSETRALFIAKYTDTGILEWVRKMESSNSIGIILTGSANNLAVDDAGAVYFTTHFKSDINLNGTLVVPDPEGLNTNYFFIAAKFDALGAYQWHWNSTHTGDDRGQDIAITPTGNVIFSVKYASALTVNGVTTENATGGMALIELQADGTYVWDHHFLTASATASYSIITAIETDAENNVYIGGQNRTTLTWDTETIFAPINASYLSAFVIKLNAEREIAWANFFGNPNFNDNLSAVKISQEGKIYAAGVVRGTVEFNENLSITTNGDANDIFWAAFTAEGVAIEAGTFGGTSAEICSDMAISPNNDIYLFGRFQNELVTGPDTNTSAGGFDFFLIKLGDLSSNALLSEIQINEVALEGFDAETFTYSVPLPAFSSEIPVVAATAADEGAEVTVVQAVNLDGTEAERTAVITVIAEDPDYTSEYTVTFRVMSGDASLVSISVDEELLEGFDPEVFDYSLSLPAATTEVPVVSAVASDPNAEVTIVQAANLTGTVEERSAVVTVVAEDPEYTSEYTITFRLMSSDATLADIMLDGVSIEGFDPEVNAYYFSLANDEEIPEVTVLAADENATVTVGEPIPPTGEGTYWVVEIFVTAEDPLYGAIYTVAFRYMEMDASLSEITLDEVALEGFDPEVFSYAVTLPVGSTEVPAVGAVAASENASVVITQATDLLGDEAARTATIVVTAEDEDYTQTYTIVFDRDVTGVENPASMDLRVFPNPTFGTLNITGIGNTVKAISLHNITGQAVWSNQGPGGSVQIDLGDMPGGIYLLRIIHSQGQTEVMKVIKR